MEGTIFVRRVKTNWGVYQSNLENGFFPRSSTEIRREPETILYQARILYVEDEP